MQLDPSIKHDPWTKEEDELLMRAHAQLGNQWVEIAKMLPGRRENHVKVSERALTLLMNDELDRWVKV